MYSLTLVWAAECRLELGLLELLRAGVLPVKSDDDDRC